MIEYGFEQEIVDRSGNISYARKGDEGLVVEFYKNVRHLQQRSMEEGRPIYDEQEFVRIMFPGDKTRVVEQPSNDQYRNRFRAQYEAYLRKEDQSIVNGTRLEDYTPLPRYRVEELKALKIFTVEQLAQVSDHNLDRLGRGSRVERDAAIAWLQKAAGNAGITKLTSENEALKNEIASLKQQIVSMSEQFEKRKKSNKEE